MPKTGQGVGRRPSAAVQRNALKAKVKRVFGRRAGVELASKEQRARVVSTLVPNPSASRGSTLMRGEVLSHQDPYPATRGQIARGLDRSKVLKDFKRMMNESRSVPIRLRSVYEKILFPKQRDGFSWKSHNRWRPCDSEFAFGWMRFYLSKQWTKKEWTLIRRFVIWMISRSMVHGIPVKEARGWKGMKELTSFLPGVGVGRIINSETWSSPHFDKVSPSRRWVEEGLLNMASQGLSDSDSSQALASITGGVRRVVGRNQSKFAVHDIDVQLAMHLLLPNASESLQRGPEDGNGINDTPAVRMDLCGKRDVVSIRPTLSVQGLIHTGSTIWNVDLGMLIVVLNLRWEQHPDYVAARARGIRPSEERKWNTANRRPWVRMEYAGFWPYTDHRGVRDGWTLCTEKLVINYGSLADRTELPPDGMRDLDWWEGWTVRTDVSLNLRSVRGLRGLRGKSVRQRKHKYDHWLLTQVFPKQRAELRRLRQGPVDGHKEGIRIRLGLGWDAFRTSSFGKKHRSATGFYAHVLNSCPRLPSMMFAVTDKKIPVHAVLQELWTSMEELSVPRMGLMTEEDEVGNQTLKIVSWKASVNAVCLDKEMQDHFHQTTGSSRDNRIDGCLYRGCEEGLECEEMVALDTRYCRNWNYTSKTRKNVLNACTTHSQFDRICRMEGWSRRAFVHHWQPKCLDLNPFLVGVSDIMHTWDGILKQMWEWITPVYIRKHPTSFWDRMQTYINSVYVLNHRGIPSDPFGLLKSDRNNMKLRIYEAFNTWLGLHALYPGEMRVYTYRLGLELMCSMYSCENDEQVLSTQRLLRKFLKYADICSLKDGVSMNFPKMRVLINLCYVYLPLYYNCLFWEQGRIESDHRGFKRCFKEHWNWSTDTNVNIVDYMERLRGLEFLDRGLKVGPDLQWGLSKEALEMCDPEDPTKPLFPIETKEGWGEQRTVRLECDLRSIRGGIETLTSTERRELMSMLTAWQHGTVTSTVTEIKCTSESQMSF